MKISKFLKIFIFLNFQLIFSLNLRKNRLKSNKELFQWLIEQNVSSSAWRVIRCSGKSSRRGLATFVDLLRRKLKIWWSSIRSNFYLTLCSDKVDCDGSFGHSAEFFYRLWLGQNFGSRFEKFRQKNDKFRKFRKFDFFNFFRKFISKLLQKSIKSK